MTFPVHERRAVGVAPNVVWDVDTLSWVRMTQPVVNADVVNVGGQVEVAGPLTDDELRATPVPVSGTFYPETQPVSGAFYPATQPVSGTFWPATQPVSAAALPLPSGASTSASQAVLESLVDTLHELIQRLAPLGSMMNGNAVGLRVVGVSMPSTAVTGPITSAQSIAEKNVGGVAYTQRVAAENMNVLLSNINNCVAA